MTSQTETGLESLRISRESIQHVMETIEEHAVTLVNLQFSDIGGGTRAVTIPAGLLPRVFTHGYRFDGAAMTGSKRAVEVDLFLFPDPSSLTILPPNPAAPHQALLFCWVTKRDGASFAGDPRTTLERQLRTASDMGLDYRVGIELEFYLYRGASLQEAELLPNAPESGYFGSGEDDTAAVRDQIVATLQELGIGVHGAHHETGPGQQELDLRHAGGVRMGDQLVSTRQVVKHIARAHGFRATFMAKPFLDTPGCGLHLFQQVRALDDGDDLLHDVHHPWNLSDTARHIIGGQLAFARAMSMIMCTTVNSYKRLADGHRAPTHANWARVTNAALLRIPSAPTGGATDIELRSPDPMTNPYLAFAVAIGTAIEGIRKRQEPPDPLDESLVSYDNSELTRLGVPRLPQTMGEALDETASSDVIRNILGAYIFDQLLSIKRSEWEDYRRQVSPWEHARYGES